MPKIKNYLLSTILLSVYITSSLPILKAHTSENTKGMPFYAEQNGTPSPNGDTINDSIDTNGSPLNNPITGSRIEPEIVGGEQPPSLQTLQGARPNDGTGSDLKPDRAAVLKEAAHIFGAQGGLAARSYALNEMLRRYESQLDAVYDFKSLVLPVGEGKTLMIPPIVTEAQMAFALGDNGNVARETACVYQITRKARLTSLPPNWRSYLVRYWNKPRRPSEVVLPKTKTEVAYWNKWVAEGWGNGEKQAVEIFLSDTSRLERDITGMARYRVLLRSKRVEEPKLTFEISKAKGGGDLLRLGDKVIRIAGQSGLQAKIKGYNDFVRNCGE